MTGTRQPTRQPLWASRLRRVAVVAAFAIASSALLPLVHGATSHLSECGVCSSFAHNGAGVADIVAGPELAPVSSGPELESLEPPTVLTLRALDSSEARAPPASSVSI